MLCYDLYLTDENGNTLDLTEEVTVKIPYDPTLHPVGVYHFGSDFEISDPLDFTLEDYHIIVFNTDSFSYFGVEFVPFVAEDDATDEEDITDSTEETVDSEDVDEVEVETDEDVEEVEESEAAEEEVETTEELEAADSKVEEAASETVESNPSIENIEEATVDVEEGNKRFPKTGEAAMGITTALGLLFTTLGTALGFEKRD